MSIVNRDTRSYVDPIEDDGPTSHLKKTAKDRRAFTPAEDAALRAGYLTHGTAWARIARDPIFSGPNGLGRRSTDLRDRFRNAWPKDYEREGYKPRRRNRRTVFVGQPGDPSFPSGSGGARPVKGDSPDRLPIPQPSRLVRGSGQLGGRAGRQVDFPSANPSSASYGVPYPPGQPFPPPGWNNGSWQQEGGYVEGAPAAFGNHAGSGASQEASGGSSAVPHWYGNPESSHFALYGAQGSGTGQYQHPQYKPSRQFPQQNQQTMYQHESSAGATTTTNAPASATANGISPYYSSQQWYPSENEMAGHLVNPTNESNSTSGGNVYQGMPGFAPSFTPSSGGQPQHGRTLSSKNVNEHSSRGIGSGLASGSGNVRWEDR